MVGINVDYKLDLRNVATALEFEMYSKLLLTSRNHNFANFFNMMRGIAANCSNRRAVIFGFFYSFLEILLPANFSIIDDFL